MRASRIPRAVLFVISGIALADDSYAPKDQPARFTITMKRKDDSVEVHADKDKTLFSVKSPFGISQAVIERREDAWPQAVVLRLHLKGLSSFRASNGKVRLDAAVSMEEGKQKVSWRSRSCSTHGNHGPTPGPTATSSTTASNERSRKSG